MALRDTVSSPALNGRLTGDKELQAKMAGLAPRIQQKIFLRAIKPSLQIMMNAAKANVMAVPVENPTGLVRKAIASKIQIQVKGRQGSKYKTIGKLGVFYGESGRGRDKAKKPTKNLQASLAHLIEFGFKLTYYFGWKIRPQNIEARPFMTPAFKAHKAQAEASFLAAIQEGCEAEKVRVK